MKHYSMLDKNVFDRFVKPDSGEVIEIRVLNCNGNSKAWEGFAKGTVSGYYDHHSLFFRDASRLIQEDARLENLQIYMTLQVIDPSLIGRAFNRLVPAKVSTTDKDVIAYRWLPIDLDPVRKSGIASSDEELERAGVLAEEICSYLSKAGWAAPIKAMSGNGYHLLYGLQDLPAQDVEAQKKVKTILEKLSSKFSNEHVHLDTALYNPARVIKLYGTIARKGTPVPEGKTRIGRPHRQSYIYDLGE